jgi:hypothetical protein
MLDRSQLSMVVTAVAMSSSLYLLVGRKGTGKEEAAADMFVEENVLCWVLCWLTKTANELHNLFRLFRNSVRRATHPFESRRQDTFDFEILV